MLTGRSSLLIRYGLPLACLIATGVVFLFAGNLIRSRGEAAFITVTNDSLSALNSRMKSYTQALSGLSGFLDASNEVSALDWKRNIAALKIYDNLPGMTGLGYVGSVEAARLDQFKVEMQKLGVPDLTIRPETPYDQKLIVVYIEPLETNRTTRGLDISFEEAGRIAALKSRESGAPQITSPIPLRHAGTHSWGFMLMQPHYQRGMPVNTVAARQVAFRGWITAWLSASRIMSDLTESQGKLFNIRISDPEAPPGQRVIFDRITTAGEDMTGIFTRRATFNAQGRSWELEWRSTPHFDLLQNRYAKWLFLIAGLMITALMTLYVRSTQLRHKLVTQQVEIKTRELTELNDRNNSILVNAMIGIMVLDGEDHILLANPAVEKLFEQDQATLQGMTFHELVDTPASELNVPQGLISARSKNGKPLYLAFQRNFWVHNGERRQTVLINDETAKTLANQTLLESERRWNLALKGARIGVYDIDLTTNTSVVSNTWRQLMGVASDDEEISLQAHFLARVHPDDLARLQQADHDCIAGLTERSIAEFRVLFPHGWHWMHSNGAVAERDANHNALRFIGAQTDVTELRHARDALAHSEERFRLLLLNAPVGMAVMDIDGCITEPNAAICAITGYSSAELTGFRFVLLFSEDEVESLVTKIADLNGETNKFYSGEHRILTKDGLFRWGEVKVSCVIDGKQDDEIYIIQINDVTHKREVDRVKGEFIATVSHELRTPLTSIKGALDLVSRGKASQLDARCLRLLEIASINTDRLISLVNDILDMEKISAGTENFIYTDVSCKQLIQNVTLQIRPIAEKNQLKIVWQDDCPDALVRADAQRAGQVLLNFLSNACKFSHQGGEINVGFSILGSDVRFAVFDHGEGMPESFHAMVFERFSQADSSDTRRKGGTGLGLSISKQIVERMGGQIGFQSVPGKCTEFWFTCPLAAPKPLPVVTLATTENDPETKGTKRILHLQNDPEFAAMVRASLDDVASVATAKDVNAAQVALTAGCYDIIIIDWRFLEGQSKSLLDDIEFHQPQARVIALSPNQDEEKDPQTRMTETSLSRSTPEVVSWLKDKMNQGAK